MAFWVLRGFSMSYSVLLTRMEVEMQSRLVHTDTKNFKKDYNFRAKNILSESFNFCTILNYKMLRNIFQLKNWFCRTVYKGLESLFPGRSSP